MKVKIYYLNWEQTGVPLNPNVAHTKLFWDNGMYQDMGGMELFGYEEQTVPDSVFGWMNHGSGMEDPDLLGGAPRSMSAGDIVEVDGQKYLCAAAGWVKFDG
ncbi:MAG TPA: hypothetical protein VK667_07405 [Ktedonobacteraceae bacterium]|nr:hypothetical protein [Ktedonobacteraceae bacterium]